VGACSCLPRTQGARRVKETRWRRLGAPPRCGVGAALPIRRWKLAEQHLDGPTLLQLGRAASIRRRESMQPAGPAPFPFPSFLRACNLATHMPPTSRSLLGCAQRTSTAAFVVTAILEFWARGPRKPERRCCQTIEPTLMLPWLREPSPRRQSHPLHLSLLLFLLWTPRAAFTSPGRPRCSLQPRPIRLGIFLHMLMKTTHACGCCSCRANRSGKAAEELLVMTKAGSLHYFNPSSPGPGRRHSPSGCRSGQTQASSCVVQTNHQPCTLARSSRPPAAAAPTDLCLLISALALLAALSQLH
jgi:hypothetical protein